MHGTPWAERDTAWSALTSDVLDVGGRAVSVVHTGEPGRPGGSDPDDDPVLLLHGLGGHAGSWAELLARLAGNRPAVAVDLPGFGATEPAHRHDARPTRLVAFLERLLTALDWPRVEVHGNSMGGMVAALFAAQRPDLVARLVLGAPALPAPRSAAWKVPPTAFLQFAPFAVPRLGELFLRARVRRSSPEALVRQSFDALWGDPSRARPSVVDVSIDNSRYGSEQPWRVPAFTAAAEELVRLMAAPGRLNAAVDAVEAPTLVVWGDQDPLVTRPVIDGLRRRRSDWVFEEFDGVGHQPHLEAPDLYVDAVDAWRGRVKASRLRAVDAG